jgi:hypothetical protein
MAKNLRAFIGHWATAAIEVPTRRVQFVCTSLGLIVVGSVLLATSGNTNTEYVYSCSIDTGQCGFSTQRPSIFALLGNFVGIVALAIGVLMAIALGIKVYQRSTAGTGSASSYWTAPSAVEPTASPTGPSPTPAAGMRSSVPTSTTAHPPPSTGPTPSDMSRDFESGQDRPTPRLKGKMIQDSTEGPGKQL